MTSENEEQSRMLQNRLAKNLRRVGHAARRLNVSCYRIYDADIPEIPLYVDWYEGRVHISVLRRSGTTEAEDQAWAEAMVDAVQTSLQVAPEKVFVKTRRRQKGTSQYEVVSRREVEFTVGESGLNFIVNLSDYLDTGLFLDHRITREMVRDEASGKQMLNLFAYTGAFSVYAAAGGASSTTTVDMSNTYLAWAERNMAANGFVGGKHSFERADILVWLEKEEYKRQNRYDLVVFDPPTFSKSKKMQAVLDIQRDHPWMLKRVVRMTKRGGVIYFSTNFRDFRLKADHLAVSEIEEITDKTTPFDFRYSRPHRCWRIVV